MNPASNLVLVGPMGAGKTSLGRQLARRLGLAFVDADAQLEEQAGVSVSTLFELEGEAGFRAREQALLLDLLQGQGRLLATGGGAVLSEATRQAMRERAFVVWLQVDVEQQLVRLARDHTRPLLAQGDRRQTLEALARARDPLYAEFADHAFPAEARDAATAARRLAQQLDRHWTRAA
jgi:shikimate kinase